MAIKHSLDKENTKKIIVALIEKYKKVVDEKKANNYNEEMTKKDFILPLFSALGWNTEDSNEVTAEEKISKKRVDYGFKLNGIPKFFLEAKKINEDLLNTKFVEQAINYSWNKGCTWAVLTNFDTLAIFNAEWKVENPWLNRFRVITYNEFIDKFDTLWLLSKDSFENNLIDREAEKVAKKEKRVSVDKQLLYDFTRFRELLSKNITKLNQNQNVSEYELDESVQRILDRLIFIRNCEDRELEPRILIANYREWDTKGKGQLIKSLRDTFKSFDGLYNSKIFSEHLCDKLDIDNPVLREIIEGLYYTKDKSVSYDFSAIDADILGTIYEQYLGHILKKTEKRATLTENNIHRKEQGIYYTPTYIVNYIVKSTVGKYLENKKNNMEQIKILDLACGSGSFLIKAFDVLNEYQSKTDFVYHQAELDFKTDVIFTKKAKILQNNIFGVDLDKQAVEIAQLNLLLKIAEKKKRLPLLSENIKCGNSIIDDEKYAGNKAFKWKSEFAKIMDKGGFDVVIGNPPWVRQETISNIKPYLELNYETFAGTADLYTYFIERAIKLLKPGGYFGFIVSGQFMRSNYGRKLREFLKSKKIETLVYFGDLPVFGDATTYPCIIIVKNEEPDEKHFIKYLEVDNLNFTSLESYVSKSSYDVYQKLLPDDEWKFTRETSLPIFDKIHKNGTELGQLPNVKIYFGIKTGLNKAFIIDEDTRRTLLEKDPNCAKIIKPFVSGEDIQCWAVDDSKNKYIILMKIGLNIEDYPSIKKHLESFKDELSQRTDFKPNLMKWYHLRPCDYYEEFEKPKVVFRGLSIKGEFPYVENSLFVNNPASIISGGTSYLSAILNSKLVWFFIVNKCPLVRGNFRRLYNYQIEKIPIAYTNQNVENEINSKVFKATTLSKQLYEIGDKITDERIRIQEEMEKIEHQIDNLVYEIYGITEDEKEIIEQSIK